MKNLKRKTGREKFLQGLVSRYQEEFGVDVVDMDEVARWAYRNKLWTDRPYDPVKRLRRELSRACAHQYFDDPQGREPRLMHAYPAGTDEEGNPVWEWCPLVKMRPRNAQMSFAVRRRAILADCKQLYTDHGSYNDNNESGVELPPLDLDFGKDVVETDLPTEYPDENPEA